VHPIGGYAVAFHGHPRYTKDIDFWIDRSQKNAKNILVALRDFGFGEVGLSESDFLEPGQIIQLGFPPNRIDILTSIKNADFDECYANKVRVKIEGVSVDFIDLENLKPIKLASGSRRDRRRRSRRC
jgi:hypothetical protein